MISRTVKSELREIAKRLSPSASYADAMYELYVRMKIAKGKQAAERGRLVPHGAVRRHARARARRVSPTSPA